MSRTKKPVREIPFADIEQQFRLASYHYFGRFFPAVVGDDDDGYMIRVFKNEMRRGADTTTAYDYFYTDPEGTVTTAPRGYAKDYKPARITGLDEAVAKYAGGAR